jgi:hypothetical protein
MVSHERQHSLSAALRVAIDANAAEACREAGPQVRLVFNLQAVLSI